LGIQVFENFEVDLHRKSTVGSPKDRYLKAAAVRPWIVARKNGWASKVRH